MARCVFQRPLVSQYAEDETETNLTTTFTTKVSLTVQESGNYIIDAYVEISSKSTTYSHMVQLLHNGALLGYDIRECQDTTDFFAVRMLKVKSLNAGDVLELQVAAETSVTAGCRRARLHILRW